MAKIRIPAVGPIRRWFRRRAERKTMLLAMETLDRLPADVLSDIGISRDEIILASQARVRQTR